MTKEEALDIVIELEDSFKQGGMIGQTIAFAELSPDTITSAYQLLLDDGTIHRMSSKIPTEKFYFQKMATDLVKLGICKCKENPWS